MKKISLSFFALLILFIQVIFTDTIIYITGLRYIIANVIALIFNIGLIILCIQKKWIKIELDFSKWDIIFIVIFVLGTVGTIVFPDEFWDTYSYHLYLQENPFADKIHDDYFPGRTLTSFVFPMADRIYMMFRAALGFRLGTVPGYLLIGVMFYQIKKILKKLTKSEVKDMYISILSMLPLTAFIILQQLGTYYVDNFSIVILLEFIYVILYESDGIFKDRPRLYFLALITGIGVCIKITNALYMFGPLVYVLIKNFKDIKEVKWFDYILLVLTAFLPMLTYFIDAIIQTGSPIFPYYNTVFKSQYFAEANWLDARYGPKTIIEFILWPIYILKEPARAYEGDKTDLAFPIGYIIAICYLIYVGYKRIIKKEKNLNKEMILYTGILLYLYAIWEKFVIGYTRYAGIIAVLSIILGIKIVLDCIKKQQIIGIMILSGILLFAGYQGVSEYIEHGTPITYIQAYYQIPGAKDKIKQNIKQVFKDREVIKYDIDGIWGVIRDDSAVPTLLNTDDRLVHLEYGFKTGESEKSKQIYWDNVLNNEIYVPMYELKTEEKLKYFDKFHFELVEIVDKIENVRFLKGDQTMYIVKVKYNENITENSKIYEKLLKQFVSKK